MRHVKFSKLSVCLKWQWKLCTQREKVNPVSISDQTSVSDIKTGILVLAASDVRTDNCSHCSFVITDTQYVHVRTQCYFLFVLKQLFDKWRLLETIHILSLLFFSPFLTSQPCSWNDLKFWENRKAILLHLAANVNLHAWTGSSIKYRPQNVTGGYFAPG